MTELPDYNKITFPDMPPIPLENIVPDSSPEVGMVGSQMCKNRSNPGSGRGRGKGKGKGRGRSEVQ